MHHVQIIVVIRPMVLNPAPETFSPHIICTANLRHSIRDTTLVFLGLKAPSPHHTTFEPSHFVWPFSPTNLRLWLMMFKFISFAGCTLAILHIKHAVFVQSAGSHVFYVAEKDGLYPLLPGPLGTSVLSAAMMFERVCINSRMKG